MAGTGLNYICRLVKENVRNCFAIVKDESMYVLFYNLGKSTQEIMTSKEAIYSTAKHLESYDIICGLSNVFFDITEIDNNRFMAQDVLKVGSSISKSKKIFEFKDYALYCIISKIKETPHYKAYIHPALKKLISYDEKFNTDYFSTLKTYILSFKDLSYTSTKLNIHRNSVKYRLQKIVDICDIDFTDELLCAQLLCNFYLINEDYNEL